MDRRPRKTRVFAAVLASKASPTGDSMKTKPKTKPAAKKAAAKPSKTARSSKPARHARPAPKKAAAKSAPRPVAKPAAKADARRRPVKASDIAAAGSMTEAQVRRMSPADYMNDVQLEFFRRRLLQMREEVLAREVDVKERLKNSS